MKPVKVAFVLASSSHAPLASTRIFALNMLPYLERAGFAPTIAFEPERATEQPDVAGLARKLEADGVGVAVFQKVHGTSVLQEVTALRNAGIRTVYAVCDLIENPMVAATDATVVVTEYLKGLYDAGLQHKMHVVHDGIENPDVFKTNYATTTSNARALRAVLVTGSALDELPAIGDPPPGVEVLVIGRYPPTSTMHKARRAYGRFRSNKGDGQHSIVRRLFGGRFEKVNWNPATVHHLLVGADVGIIPVDMQRDPLPGHDVSWWQVKSENRLTMKMAAGLPVIASPVPSYLAVIEHGINGYVATTRDEWLACFEALRDPGLRQRMGQRARASVLPRFSRDEQARKLVAVLQAVRRAT